MNNDADTRSGGNRNQYQQRHSSSRRQEQPPKRKTVDILPDPELLEAYDYIVEGSAQQILDMFTREQQHRHEWELKALRTHHFSTVLGQFLGFLICVSVFVSASLIGIYGDKTIAATIWVFGLSIIVMAGLVWMYAKTLSQKPLFGRPQMRTHFKPVKEKSGSEAPDSEHS